MRCLTNPSSWFLFNRLSGAIGLAAAWKPATWKITAAIVLGGMSSLAAPLVAAQAAGPGALVTPELLAAAVSAAQAGDMQAEVNAGRAYAEGTAGPKNYHESLKWFQAAASQGSVEAGAWMGSLYLLGHGVPRDVNRAAGLIQPAAALHNPTGLRFLGMMYETGQGAPRDYSQAAGLYAEAVALQDANACDRLGVLYLHGLGVKRDVARAYALFTQGANLGDGWSELHLGQMYQSGYIPRPVAAAGPSAAPPASKVFKSAPDYASALRYYAASAAQRNSVAIYKLGVLYENGLGVTQDYAQALAYYGQAASQRLNPALVAFGRMNELGLGAEVNLFNAYVGYSLAAEAGDPGAGQHLRALLGKLGPGDLQSAQALLKAVKQTPTPANRNAD